MRVEPPLPDDAPPVSRATAWSAFEATGLFPQTAKNYAADVRYGLFSDDQYGGTRTPTYQRLPAWIVRWDNVPDEVGAKGGANTYNPTADTESSTTTSTAPGNVNILVVIDARTGKYILAIDDGTAAG